MNLEKKCDHFFDYLLSGYEEDCFGEDNAKICVRIYENYFKIIINSFGANYLENLVILFF